MSLRELSSFNCHFFCISETPLKIALTYTNDQITPNAFVSNFCTPFKITDTVLLILPCEQQIAMNGFQPKEETSCSVAIALNHLLIHFATGNITNVIF